MHDYTRLAIAPTTPPKVEAFIRDTADLFIADVHAMLRLPLPDQGIAEACNFTIASALLGFVSGASVVLYDPSRRTRAFAIWTNTTVELERLQQDHLACPEPHIVRGTRLGTLDFKYFAGMETDPPTRMEEQYDAVLYLGPVSSITFSELPAALCTDAEYTKMHINQSFDQASTPWDRAGCADEHVRHGCGAQTHAARQRVSEVSAPSSR